jgi:hypothetical protein
MSRPTDLRAAAIALIGGAGLGLKSVDKHVGRYSVDDLKRLLSASPACALGITGATKPERRASGELAIDVAFAAVVVTRQQRTIDADDDAVNLAIAVAALINGWVPAATVPRCNPAVNIRCDGVGDSELDREQMAVWAVTWSHTVVIGTDEIAAGIDPEHPLATPVETTVTHPTRGDEIVEAGT